MVEAYAALCLERQKRLDDCINRDLIGESLAEVARS